MPNFGHGFLLLLWCNWSDSAIDSQKKTQLRKKKIQPKPWRFWVKTQKKIHLADHPRPTKSPTKSMAFRQCGFLRVETLTTWLSQQKTGVVAAVTSKKWERNWLLDRDPQIMAYEKNTLYNWVVESPWNLVGGWTTHLKSMLIKLDHFPR